jgi:hypothetical protein
MNERHDVEHRKTSRRVGQQRDEAIERMPTEVVRVAQQIVVSAEQIVGIKRRLPGLEMTSDLGQERQADGKVVVGQRKAAPWR